MLYRQQLLSDKKSEGAADSVVNNNQLIIYPKVAPALFEHRPG